MASSCSVPGCRGKLHTGPVADQTVKTWCVACERRLAQLRDCQERKERPEPVEVLADRELFALVASRLLTQKDGAKAVGRSQVSVHGAVRRNRVAHVRLGNSILVSRASLQAWSAKANRHVPRHDETIVPILPTKESEAIALAELAKRSGLKLQAVANWATNLAKRANHIALQRRVAEVRGRATWVYWLDGQAAQ